VLSALGIASGDLFWMEWSFIHCNGWKSSAYCTTVGILFTALRRDSVARLLSLAVVMFTGRRLFQELCIALTPKFSQFV